MQIAETVEAIIKEASLKPIEERAIVSRFGLRGEPATRSTSFVAMFQADETVKVKHVTKEWVRNKEAHGLLLMRSAMGRLKINASEFKEACKDEPYKSLCDVLIGYDPTEMFK